MRTLREMVTGSHLGDSRRVQVVAGISRLTAVLVAAFIIVAGVFMVVGPAHADDDESQYDFYTLSSNVTAYFSTAAEPGEGEGLQDAWKSMGTGASGASDGGTVSAAEGGNFLGYGDNDVSGFSGWLVSKATGSSNTVGYESLVARSDDGSVSNAYAGILAYGQYGSLLSDLGLDSVSTGLSLNVGPMIGGSIMWVLYMLAGGVDILFKVMFWALDLFNPFKLFYTGVSQISRTLADGMTRGEGVPQWMQSLDAWISGWYQALVNLSWSVLMPLFIVLFAFSALMWRKGNALSGLKKLVIRMLFLGVGLPLMGSMYTASLAAMTDAADGAGMGATRVVISTFNDFESWAEVNRLAVPRVGVSDPRVPGSASDLPDAVLVWDATKGRASGESVQNLRSTTMAINVQAHPEFSSLGQYASLEVSDLGSVAGGTVQGGSDSDNISDKAVFLTTSNMLTRYMTADKYTASELDTAFKGRLTQFSSRDAEGAVKSCATTWFNVKSDGTMPKVNDCDNEDPASNPILVVEDGSGLTATAGENNQVIFSTSSGRKPIVGYPSKSNGDPLSANLSPLSLYNYLNSTFSSNSVTTYSSSNAVSSATREYHNSVNLVGSSGMGFLYWSNSAVTLLCFIILGFAYAVGMMVGTVRNSLRVITAVPFATLGALAGIAKVVIYTFAMIVEIIGTLFIYRVVQEIIISTPSIFENGLSQMLDNLGNFGEYLKSSGAIAVFTSLLSTIVLIVLTVVLVRFRGVFIKAVTESVTKVVDKLLDTQVAPPAGGGLAPALAGGVGAGLGSAAANRMMSGKSLPGAKGGGKPGSKGGSGITTGQVPAPGAPGGGSGGAGAPASINGTDDGPDGEVGPGATDGDTSQLTSGSGETSEAGGGTGVSVSADADSQDPAGTASTQTSASDRDLAREVEARGGLSDPNGSAGDSGSSGGIEAAPSGGNDPASSSSTVSASDDTMSQASQSVESSMKEHAAADKSRLGQTVQTGAAVGHGASAAAKGSAGDTQGAVNDGQKAMGNLQQAQSKGQESRAHRQAANVPSSSRSAQPSQAQSSHPRQAGSAGTQRQSQPSRGAQPAAAPVSVSVPSRGTVSSTPVAPSRGQAPRQTSLSAPRVAGPSLQRDTAPVTPGRQVATPPPPAGRDGGSEGTVSAPTSE